MFIYYIKCHLNVYLLYPMSIKCLFIISKSYYKEMFIYSPHYEDFTKLQSIPYL